MSDQVPSAVPPPSPLRLAVRVGGFLLGAVCGLAIAWAAGLLWFAATLPGKPEPPLEATDAIVVLTGGSERVSTGLRLLEADLGRKLFVSGVHKHVDVDDILKLAKKDRPELACCVVLGYSADDTVGNAAETAAWMAIEQYGSLRLVTASYHMRRSLLEFHRAMPGMRILPHPVFPDAVKLADWWRWPGTAHLLATEYTKYLGAVARHWVLPKEKP